MFLAIVITTFLFTLFHHLWEHYGDKKGDSGGCFMLIFLTFLFLCLVVACGLIIGNGVSSSARLVGWGIVLGCIIGWVIVGLRHKFKEDKEAEEYARRREAERPQREQEREAERREWDAERRRVEEEHRRRQEIERTGMSAAMDYERENGGVPKDVSSENLGYDILSEREGNDRYIEVKAREGTGRISLTENEWNAAKQLRNNYYLYAVFNCSNDSPDLHILKNPAEVLSPEYDPSEKKYMVSYADIIKASPKSEM
jgi:hypothetical protein